MTKLQERESSAEVYARELEARLEAVGSRGDTDSAMMVELQKEVARLKEVETSSEQYIRDLEAKLASSDESAASLSRKVTQMEADLEKREDDYRNLLSRFELLDNGKESQAIAAELEAKNVELHGLEARLAEATAKHESLASQFDSLTARHRELSKASDGTSRKSNRFQSRSRSFRWLLQPVSLLAGSVVHW